MRGDCWFCACCRRWCWFVGRWPVFTSIGAFCMAVGFVSWFHKHGYALLLIGVVVLILSLSQ